MNLRHLRHFDVLATTGSLHRAARRLGLRQPALSQSIRALEADVGTRLVDRSLSGTRLTPAGSAFLNEARHILTALDRAIDVARHTAAGASAPLRLGITRDTASDRLAAILRNAPQPEIVVSDGFTAGHLSLLADGMLDLALLPLSAMTDHAHSEALWQEDIHLVLPATHPLAADGAIDIHRLRDLPVTLGSGDHASAADHALTSACHAAGIDLPATLRVRHLEVRLMLVAAGLGVSVLPAGSLVLTGATGIVGRPLTPPLSSTIAAAWPKSGLTSAAQRFLDVARSLA
ncbi:MAG: LysR family transcriptional regulator [Alphaproteobacteria bacterium]